MTPINQYNILNVEPHETIPFVLAGHVENAERTHCLEVGKFYTEFTGNGFKRFL